MSREEFRKSCRKCWEKPHGFAVIDLTSKKDAGKYRSGLGNFLYPTNKQIAQKHSTQSVISNYSK